MLRVGGRNLGLEEAGRMLLGGGRRRTLEGKERKGWEERINSKEGWKVKCVRMNDRVVQ